MAAFLTPQQFADWAKKPAWANDPLAAALLTTVEGWIRTNKPGIADDDAAAKVVTFEVTRDALIYGDFGPLSEFTKKTAHSERSGTIDSEKVEQFITDRHRQMLGLTTYPKPAYYFGD